YPLFLLSSLRSGSMAGSRIAAVRDTLQFLLRSLPVAARFNIIGFGSYYEKLWPESKEMSNSTLEQAERVIVLCLLDFFGSNLNVRFFPHLLFVLCLFQHVQSIDSNFGGTELLPVLRDALTAPSVPKFPRQIF